MLGLKLNHVSKRGPRLWLGVVRPLQPWGCRTVAVERLPVSLWSPHKFDLMIRTIVVRSRTIREHYHRRPQAVKIASKATDLRTVRWQYGGNIICNYSIKEKQDDHKKL